MEIRPECCPDESDAIDLHRFVFQEMDILGERDKVLQFRDSSEEVVMIEEMVPLDIDHGKELLGKVAQDSEPGFLPVCKTQIAGDQGDCLSVSRKRRHHRLDNMVYRVCRPQLHV